MYSRTHRAILFATLVLILTFAGIVLPARAQSPPAEPPVTGIVSVSRGTDAYRESIEGTLVFEHDRSDRGDRYYVAKGGSITWSVTGSDGDCVYSGTFTVALDPGVDYSELFIGNDDEYAGHVALDNSRLRDAVIYTCEDGSATLPGSLYDVFYTGFNRFSLRDDDSRLFESWVDAAGTVHQWDLRFQPKDLILEVEPQDYATWIPTPGRTEADPGNSIDIDVTIKNADGSATTASPHNYLFELIDTSREPGIALNFPRLGKTTPDLRITESGTIIDQDAEGQRVMVEPGRTGGNRTSFTVSAYDGGAFSTLKVSAFMPDGSTLVGFMPGAPDDPEIKLPKRTGASKVADAWKQQRGAAFADDDDSDPLPAGDLHAGDGLTLYEEYRGFMVKGILRRSDPKKKTIFIRNSVGGTSLAGVALYRRITGLEVYADLLPAEFDPSSRVINFNHARGDHLVDQHGLWIRSRGGAEGVSRSESPGPPKSSEYIDLADASETYRRGAGRSRARFNEMAPHTAHELLHASNVWHHGSRDVLDVKWRLVWNAALSQFAVDTEGMLIVRENVLTNVEPQLEDGTRFVPALLQKAAVAGDRAAALELPIVGFQQGQHSGAGNCVMRYYVAPFYGTRPQDTARYWTGQDEIPGLGLCDSARGTEVNDASRNPQPRYGDADLAGTPPRGNCKGQLCVNDRYH